MLEKASNIASTSSEGLSFLRPNEADNWKPKAENLRHGKGASRNFETDREIPNDWRVKINLMKRVRIFFADID